MNQRGQGSIEILIALPMVLVFCFAFFLLFSLGSLRLEVLSLTQEFKVCYASTHKPEYCRRQLRQALATLPGRYRLQKVETTFRTLRLHISHQVPFQKSPWIAEHDRYL